MAENSLRRLLTPRKPVDLGLPGADAIPEPEAPAPTPAAPRMVADVSQIPAGPQSVPTPAADGSQNNAVDTELGRNVQNTLRAIPGIGGLGRVATTGGAISSGLAGIQAGLAGAGGAAGVMSAANEIANNGMPGAPSLGGADSPSLRGALRMRPEDAMAGPTSPTAMPPLGGSNVTRVGNSYSGGPNIRGDITVNGAPGGGGPISTQNMAAADALAGRETLRGQAMAMGGGAPARPAQPIALNSDNSWQARNNLRNLEVSAKSITENGGRFDTTPGESPAVAAFRAAQSADIASRGGMDAGTIARTNADAANFGAEQTAGAQRYGADARLRGDIVQAGASRANAMTNAQLSLRKDAMDRGERDRTFTAGRNDEAYKRQEDMLKGMASGPDGKVDNAKLAELRGQTNAFLGEAISAARKRGDTATAAKLEQEGPSAVGAQELRQYLAAQKLDSIAQQSNGRLPWNGDYRATDNPGGRTIVGMDKGLLWDQAKMSDGTRVPANSLRYSGGGAFSGLNPWSVPTDEFNSLDPKGLLRR